MEELGDSYRGHVISAGASGPTEGPWKASYIVLKIEPNNSYRLILQGSLLLDGLQAIEGARSAARLEARTKLDSMLDAK